MACQAGRGPRVACGEPTDGAAYVRDCPGGHAEVIRLCAFHALWIEFGVPLCTACWAESGGLVPVTITIREDT